MSEETESLTLSDQDIYAPLPPGVHPNDNSVPYRPGSGAHIDANAAVGPDSRQPAYTTGREPYKRDNYEVLPTFERASDAWSAQTVKINAAYNGGTALVVGRQKGRKSVTISVPLTLADGTTPLGVVIGPTEAEVQAGGASGYVLNVGDSVTLSTEGTVYAGVIPGNATGACQFVAFFNPPSGGLDQ